MEKAGNDAYRKRGGASGSRPHCQLAAEAVVEGTDGQLQRTEHGDEQVEERYQSVLLRFFQIVEGSCASEEAFDVPEVEVVVDIFRLLQVEG